MAARAAASPAETTASRPRPAAGRARAGCCGAVRGAMQGASAVGTAMPQLQRGGCIYMDWNGTTPVFGEVRRREDAPLLSGMPGVEPRQR